jgi:hypothetical protein
MNALQNIPESELILLIRAYLERQAREWITLKQKFLEETGSRKVNQLDVKIFGIIPYILEAYKAHALGKTNELEFREQLGLAMTKFVSDNFPNLATEKQKQVCLNVLSMYAFTIFMGHGIQQELQRTLREAIGFALGSSLDSKQIFSDESIYAIFLAKTETPETLRKKLETIFAAASPKRTAHLFRLAGKILRKEDLSNAAYSPPPASIEIATKRKCADSFLKQMIVWPEVINQRILEVFYPR